MLGRVIRRTSTATTVTGKSVIRVVVRSQPIRIAQANAQNHRILSRTMASGAAKRSFEVSNISEVEFEDISESVLSTIESTLDKISPIINPDEVSCAYGVLTLDLGKRGTWVINKQSPNKQMWWSSPLSGPRRFAYDNADRRWHWTRDYAITLGELFAQELQQISPGLTVDFKL